MFSAESWRSAICKSATARFTAVLIAIAGLALPILHAQAQQNTPETNQSQPPETRAASPEAAPTADSTDPAAPIDFHEAWFPVDSLNAGLSEPGEPLNRATPRATLESFLNLAANQEFGRAAHLFNLALIPRQEQPEQGPELARKLHEIFNRRVWINWNNLPDRPDAMEVIGAQSNQTAGEPRRSLSIASLQLDDRSVTLRLSRLKAPDRPPLWLFSAQTVGNIDALYERYGPGWLEQRLPEWLKRTGPGAIPLWKLLVLPLLLGVAVLAAWGVYRGTQMIARIGRPEWVCLIIRKSGAPLAFLTACLFGQLVIGTMLPLSGPVHSIVQPVLHHGLKPEDCTLRISRRGQREINLDALPPDVRRAVAKDAVPPGWQELGRCELTVGMIQGRKAVTVEDSFVKITFSHGFAAGSNVLPATEEWEYSFELHHKDSARPLATWNNSIKLKVAKPADIDTVKLRVDIANKAEPLLVPIQKK
jgi:hypothetical protein